MSAPLSSLERNRREDAIACVRAGKPVIFGCRVRAQSKQDMLALCDDDGTGCEIALPLEVGVEGDASINVIGCSISHA